METLRIRWRELSRILPEQLLLQLLADGPHNSSVPLLRLSSSVIARMLRIQLDTGYCTVRAKHGDSDCA